MKNEIGNVYGKLTVITRAERPEGRPAGAYWVCQCECGNEKVIRGADLRRGGVNSCGCLYGKHTIVDETGKKYGKLTVIEQVEERKRNAVQWLCKCECGNTVIVRGADLRSGQVKSCGCLIAERSREIHGINRVGKKYGKLTVINIDEKAEQGKGLRWICQCECGNITSVLGSNLESGATRSCGCLRSSYGEEKISKLLEENNIPYIKEYVFPDLCGEQKTNLRFDFAILDKEGKVKQLIEYDGEQHFRQTSHWGGTEGLELRKKNDKKKDEYCLKQGIRLVRIPYWKINEFTFEDLKITGGDDL